MAEPQPNNQIVFERTRLELHLGYTILVSRLWFELCYITIKRIHKILLDYDEWDIQVDDLKDYSKSLRAVRSTLKTFHSSNFGPFCPFGSIISVLDQARRPLGGALGMRNIYAPRRTGYIQEFRILLENAIALMDAIKALKDFNDIPP